MKTTSTHKKSPAKKEAKENSFPVVAIGASAGGLEAMMELLKHLPSETGMAYIYVQHLSPDHKSLLTEILSKKTQMKVQEIDDMDLIQPDNVFVIPYNKGIEVTDGHIKLIPRSETGTAISIDILFSSLAAAQKERVIGIILSGSASDGTLGMKAIKQEGGLTFAQDDTAKFNSMPHSAIAAGAVDFILSPKDIALELGRLSKHPLIKTVGVKNGEEDLIENSDPDLKTILNHLHKTTGVDFSVYKMNTIKRRIIRRMLLYKMTILKEYAELLSQKKEEIDILYQDLLINVTSFFRDTDIHKYLKETLFPKLFNRKKTGETLRIWVPACATGEEAYSIAMMLLEIQESKPTEIPVQIFATDLSEQAISKARIGIYTKQDLETVSPNRTQRFFIKADGGFRVNKVLRDICVFAPHNILRDPPFSRLDFISCRNLFIYFDNLAQKKAVNTFHYALNEDGFLMLGKSENISHSANLFTDFNKKYKVFSRKANSGTRTLPALLPRYAQRSSTENNSTITNKPKTKRTSIALGAVNHNRLDNAIDAVLVSEFMPASVVINYQMEIVQFRGITDLFLTHPKGKATFNILKMARPEIAFELRNAISKVIKSKQRFRKSGIEIKINSEVRSISIEIVPLEIESDEPLLLILFTEQEQTEIFSKQVKGGNNNSLAKDRRIKKLEEELAAAHADALTIAQEQEVFSEELQSAHEEVVSSNEELQTVNEELETSKEEIESTNEELITTNQELQTRNELLNEAYGYSEALFATIHEPMLVLDKNLRVKSANKTFYKTFHAKEEDTEGILLYDLGDRQWNIPRLRELLEELLPKNTHFHDFEITHTFPLIGEKTMLLNARRIIQKINNEELILLAISDVTEQTTARRKIEDSEKRYNLMLMKSPFGFAVLKGKNMVITLANDSIKTFWGKGQDLEGKPLFDVIPELKDSSFPDLIDKVYTTGTPFHGDELLAPILRNGKLEDVYFNFVYQPYLEADETISGVTVIAYEVTAQVMVKKALAAQHEAEQKALKLVEETNKRYYTMLMESPFAFCVLNGKDMVITLANDLIKDFWGKGKDIEGKTILEVLPEIKDQPFPAMLDQVYTSGIPVYANEILARLQHQDKMKERYFNVIYQPDHEADGTISGVITIAYDVTEIVLARKKAEEGETKFRSLIEEAPVATCLFTGRNMKIEIANNIMIGYWGKGENVIGKPLAEVLPELKGQPFLQILDDVFASGKTYHASNMPAELMIDGVLSTYYFDFTYKPLRNADGEVYGIMDMAIDVTEQVLNRKKIEESERKFKELAELMPQKVWTADANGNKLYFNKTLLDFAGKTLEELKGDGWKQMIHPDDWEQDEIKWNKSVNTGNKYQSESRFLRKDGKYFWHLTMAVPLKDEQDNIIQWIGSKTEIQEQRQQKEMLEIAVVNRTSELKQANEELVRMNKELEAFNYVSSHDLQEPLRKIRTIAGRILEKENQNLSDSGKNYFHLIQNAAERMQTLIQDLLAFSRLSMADRKFESIDFNVIIEEVKKELKDAIAVKNAVIEVKEICDVKVIPFQFRQLMHNLISNALKFSNPKIPPHIKISSVNITYSKINVVNLTPHKEYCHISISDNGIGFEKEFAEKIFEVFQKLHGKDEYAGTGIGLAIVKKIVDNHNGIITATSKLNIGTTFDIYIPT